MEDEQQSDVTSEEQAWFDKQVKESKTRLKQKIALGILVGGIGLGCLAIHENNKIIQNNLNYYNAKCDCSDKNHEIVTDKDILALKLKETKKMVKSAKKYLDGDLYKYGVQRKLDEIVSDFDTRSDAFCDLNAFPKYLLSILAMGKEAQTKKGDILSCIYEKSPFPVESYTLGFETKEPSDFFEKRKRAYEAFEKVTADESYESFQKQLYDFKDTQLKKVYISSLIDSIISSAPKGTEFGLVYGPEYGDEGKARFAFLKTVNNEYGNSVSKDFVAFEAKYEDDQGRYWDVKELSCDEIPLESIPVFKKLLEERAEEDARKLRERVADFVRELKN